MMGYNLLERRWIILLEVFEPQKLSVQLWLYSDVIEWSVFPHKRSLAEYRHQLSTLNTHI